MLLSGGGKEGEKSNYALLQLCIAWAVAVTNGAATVY